MPRHTAYWRLALATLCANALLLGLVGFNCAQAEGINVGVKPLNETEVNYCLDTSSIRAGHDGWTYFQRRPCLDPRSGPVEAYRVQCAQPSSGPFAYEVQRGDEWVEYFAQPSDDLAKSIARVCKFKRPFRRLPPPPMLQ